MTTFLLVRHATNDTVGKILAGRREGVYLNKEGKEQAEALARRMKSLPVAAIYSSPLERALQTADAVAGLLELKPVTSEAFSEIDFGEWAGCSFEELSGQTHFKRFNRLRSCTRTPGGELMAEAQLRFIRGMEDLRVQHPAQVVVVVSHADLIKAAVAFFAGIPLDLFHRIEISPASVTTIQMDDDFIRVLQVNHTGDLIME